MITSINQYTKENKKLLNSIREINFPNIYTDDLYLKCIPVIDYNRLYNLTEGTIIELKGKRKNALIYKYQVLEINKENTIAVKNLSSGSIEFLQDINLISKEFNKIKDYKYRLSGWHHKTKSIISIIKNTTNK